MYPMLVLSGSGIKKSVRIGLVHNIDVAPTTTSLLNLDLLPFDGRILTEALTSTQSNVEESQVKAPVRSRREFLPWLDGSVRD